MTCRSKKCEVDNGGCVDQQCNNGLCEDCAEGEYFNTNNLACRTDPCDDSACGGNLCTHDQGSVTCSCEDVGGISHIFDVATKQCIRNCAVANGGCDGQECRNGVCEDCAADQYFNLIEQSCATDPCDDSLGACGGNICTHDQGSVTCSCEDVGGISHIYDVATERCIRNCAVANGGCDGQECRNGACVACLENEYFASDSTCQINPCSEDDVCEVYEICQNDDGVAKCTEREFINRCFSIILPGTQRTELVPGL